MVARPKVMPSAVRPVAEWAGLPCDDARAGRLQPFLVAQKARMQRLYEEDVTGFEFDFLRPQA
jgi:hypothetical protein